MQASRVRSTAPLVVLLAAVLFAGRCSSPAVPLSISLESPSRVRVAGLSSAEAAALSAANLDSAAWQQIFRITTAADSPIAVAGTYTVAADAVQFEPAFAFDPGRRYRVEFDPSRMPLARAERIVSAEVSIPSGPDPPPVVVSAIYPSGEEWPANLLRFYVHFSGAMMRETGTGRVHILDGSGKEVPDALLPSTIDFWSPDQRRYTVFFEPGRLKRGIGPNLEMGRALLANRTFTVVVDTGWRDTKGRKLSQEYQRKIRVGPAREAALSLRDWRVTTPAAGSTDALVVVFPAPLDHALLLRAIGVARAGVPLDGAVTVASGETEWRFVPTEPWMRAPHELVVLSSLEDPSGNRIGRAFEVLPTDPAATAEVPERFTLPIVIR
jgi:hypothetical protein